MSPQNTHSAQTTHSFQLISSYTYIIRIVKPAREATPEYSFLLCCVLLFPSVASASPFSIQPSVSTLGVGVDVSYRQNSFIAYRLSAFTQPFDTKIKLKGIQYKTEDSSHSIGLLLDIFPFENAFRVSAGAYYFKLDTTLSTSVTKNW